MKEKYIHISKGFPNSVPFIHLLTGYEPILISANEGIDKPKNYFKLNSVKTYQDLGKEITKPKYVQLISNLAKKQGKIYINNFENEGSWDEIYNIPNTKLIGLDSSQVKMFDNKLITYKLFNDVIPVPKFEISSKEHMHSLFNKYNKGYGVFATLSEGGGGEGSKLCKTQEEIIKFATELPKNEKVLLVEGLDLVNCPSIDVLVANENEIIVYGLTDLIMEGLSTKGAQYPSKINPQLQKKAYEIGMEIGKKVAQTGAKGYFNIDLNLDENNKLYFGEINARYGAISAERMLMMEYNKIPSQPTLLDLTKMASEEGTLNGYTLGPEPNIPWYRLDLGKNKENSIYLPSLSEQQIFQKGKGMALIGQSNNNIGKLVLVGNNYVNYESQIRDSILSKMRN